MDVGTTVQVKGITRSYVHDTLASFKKKQLKKNNCLLCKRLFYLYNANLIKRTSNIIMQLESQYLYLIS